MRMFLFTVAKTHLYVTVLFFLRRAYSIHCPNEESFPVYIAYYICL